MSGYVTYSDMIARHGKYPALNLIRTMERLAQISNDIISLDLEARFNRAFEIICETDFA